jgi:transmembrane sensor
LSAKNISSNERLIDQAALWYARLDSGEASLSEFEAWRDADPRHAVAFARVIASVAILDKAIRPD